MAVPANKDELRKAIEVAFAKLTAELDHVPESLTSEKTMPGHAAGTMMSVDDLLAYLVGWGELVLKWIRLRDEGREPDFPETGYKWNQLGALARKFYRDYDALSFSERLSRFGQVKTDILAQIDRRTDADLYGSGWYEKWPLGRMIQFNTASPYVNARNRLRAWKKERGLLQK